ncbi:MAG: RAMP superfamily CRISPR-associated protein [Xanthobacteraceae bacterium]|nr:RAMP superfamily CRISPR-associated protein [Xanthobacteraceae bacterium]
MGRLIARKYLVKGHLVAETPVHVGAASAQLVADMPLARDGAGRFYLPGTSLAGPIRHWWAARRDGAAEAFGRIPDRDGEPGTAGDASRDDGHASYILVDDAVALEAPASETRDGVGIDRETGAAAPGIKYDREVLPAATRFCFRMEVELANGLASVVPERAQGEDARLASAPPPDAAALEASLGSLIKALEAGRIRFGAAKTRGLGRLRLEGTEVLAQDIGTRQGILRRLRGDDLANQRDGLVAKASADSEPAEVDVAISWRAELPVFSKSEAEGVTIDALPLVTAGEGGFVPVLAGASWKGALRAHGERVCRTLAAVSPPGCEGAEATGFLDDLEDSPLVLGLFGARGMKRAQEQRYPDGATPVPGLGALSIDDCIVGPAIPAEAWEELLSKGGDPERKTVIARAILDTTPWSGFRAATNVAIDRWTGGAADGLLFSRLEAADGRAAPAPAHSRPGAHGAADRPARPGRRPAPDVFRRGAFALFLVVLRELACGRIPVGFGVTRGLGSIAVERITFAMTARAARELGLQDGDLSFALTPDDFRNETQMSRFAAVEQAWHHCWPQEGTR